MRKRKAKAVQSGAPKPTVSVKPAAKPAVTGKAPVKARKPQAVPVKAKTVKSKGQLKKTMGKKRSGKVKKKVDIDTVKPKEKAPRKIPDRYSPGTLKVNLYSTKGKVIREIMLPKVFDSEFRPDLIRKDVKASRANRRQRYGPAPMAGMRHAVSQWGKGRGSSRVQRLTQGNDAAESPPNVGGRRAHPPTPEHDFSLKMNAKERRKARNAAIATTAMPKLVRQRGHKFGKKVTVPLVIEDDFASLVRTKSVIRVFERLNVYDDIVRATDGRHIRVGRGKMRGRRYKSPTSILIIVPELVGIQHGASNLPGVDIKTPEDLNTELLAPGGDPGRLTIFTESAVKVIGAWGNV
jgi:large subunit ribosomal protein L4e